MSYPKVDASLSGSPLVDTGGLVSNIAISEANGITKCLQSALITDVVEVYLRAKPHPSKGLVNWVPCGLWRIPNYRYICCHIKTNCAVTA